MPDSLGDTVQIENLLALMRAGDQGAKTRLIEQACHRLRVLTSQMLGRFPKVHRWEQTDDIFSEAVTKLHRSLAVVQPESARHFYNLAATQIRRVLIDAGRKHFGPEGIGAHHDSAALAESQSGLRRLKTEGIDTTEPADLLEWSEFHEQIERLPTEEREVFSLLWYDGLTQEEAAVVLGTSVRTVKRRWQSARFLIAKAILGQ